MVSRDFFPDICNAMHAFSRVQKANDAHRLNASIVCKMFGNEAARSVFAPQEQSAIATRDALMQEDRFSVAVISSTRKAGA